MRALAAAVLAALSPAPAAACVLALTLLVDVSGSIDAGEYREQMDGLAAALEDAEVVDALVQGQSALRLVQFSGAGEQAEVLGWRRMLSRGAVARTAAEIRAAPRAWIGGRTAVGDALAEALAAKAAVADCRRRVIDISGDGQVNDGVPMGGPRAAARAAGVTVNALAIEGEGRSLSVTQFFRGQVITGRDAFVITARGFPRLSPRDPRQAVARSRRAGVMSPRVRA